MYHTTNLGAYGNIVAQYADIHGYVPEADDHWQDMGWDAMTEWTDEAWAEHVAGAVEATTEAVDAVAEWQTTN